MKKILLLIIGFFYCLSVLAINESINLKTKTYKETNQAPKFTIVAQYPQIRGHALTPAQQHFNSIAKEEIMKQVTKFKETVYQFEKNPIPTEIKSHGSYFKMNYQINTVQPAKLVSLRFMRESYVAGAAHPSREYVAINFDLENDKLLSLSDLFQSDADYLNRLANYSMKLLKAKLNGAVLFKEGLAPIPKNYRVWNITPKGLKIMFNEYQVAAYVYGPQEIIVPYDKFQDIFSDKNSAAMCLKNKDCVIQ